VDQRPRRERQLPAYMLDQANVRNRGDCRPPRPRRFGTQPLQRVGHGVSRVCSCRTLFLRCASRKRIGALLDNRFSVSAGPAAHL
jgi:hypothetical protein